MRNKRKGNPAIITQEIMVETMATIDIRKVEELEKIVRLMSHTCQEWRLTIHPRGWHVIWENQASVHIKDLVDLTKMILHLCLEGMEGLEGQTRMHAPTFECIPGRYRRPNTHSYERPSGYNQNVSRSEYTPRRDGRRNTSSHEWYNRPHVFRSSSLGFPVNQAY